MKLFLDWSAYKDAGMGDAYADIPKIGGDFAKAVAVCIVSKAGEQKGRGVICASFRVSEKLNYRLLDALLKFFMQRSINKPCRL